MVHLSIFFAAPAAALWGDVGCGSGCSGHGVCQESVCECDRGWAGPSCDFDLRSLGPASLVEDRDELEASEDTQDACGGCSGRGECQAGRCVCDSGWSGADCRLDLVQGCSCGPHGTCDHAGLCHCDPGFGGESCEEELLGRSPRRSGEEDLRSQLQQTREELSELRGQLASSRPAQDYDSAETELVTPADLHKRRSRRAWARAHLEQTGAYAGAPGDAELDRTTAQFLAQRGAPDDADDSPRAGGRRAPPAARRGAIPAGRGEGGDPEALVQEAEQLRAEEEARDQQLIADRRAAEEKLERALIAKRKKTAERAEAKLVAERRAKAKREEEDLVARRQREERQTEASLLAQQRALERAEELRITEEQRSLSQTQIDKELEDHRRQEAEEEARMVEERREAEDHALQELIQQRRTEEEAEEAKLIEQHRHTTERKIEQTAEQAAAAEREAQRAAAAQAAARERAEEEDETRREAAAEARHRQLEQRRVEDRRHAAEAAEQAAAAARDKIRQAQEDREAQEQRVKEQARALKATLKTQIEQAHQAAEKVGAGGAAKRTSAIEESGSVKRQPSESSAMLVGAVCPDDCSHNGACVGGKCVCKDGFYGSSCALAMCPNNCNGKGYCSDGDCVCSQGFEGRDCSKKATIRATFSMTMEEAAVTSAAVGSTLRSQAGHGCPLGCEVHGECVSSQCVCKPGWTGAACDTSNVCSGHGHFAAGEDADEVSQVCLCDKGWGGADCSIEVGALPTEDLLQQKNRRARADVSDFKAECPHDCSSRGVCSQRKCMCHEGWKGPSCSQKIGLEYTQVEAITGDCLNDCGGHGQCILGDCVCSDGFQGPDCGEAL